MSPVGEGHEIRLHRKPQGCDQRSARPKSAVSPVHTGDTQPTGDTNSPLISTLSPVSPVSPVARVRDGFRNSTRSNAMGRNVDARVNFSESPGATGDTGDTAARKPGIAPAPHRAGHTRPIVLVAIKCLDRHPCCRFLARRCTAAYGPATRGGPQAHHWRADYDRSTLGPGSRGRAVSTKPPMSSRGCRKSGCGESTACGRGLSSSQAGAPA